MQFVNVDVGPVEQLQAFIVQKETGGVRIAVLSQFFDSLCNATCWEERSVLVGCFGTGGRVQVARSKRLSQVVDVQGCAGHAISSAFRSKDSLLEFRRVEARGRQGADGEGDVEDRA